MENDDPNKKKVLSDDQPTPPIPPKEEQPSSENNPSDVQPGVKNEKQSTKLTQDDIDRIYKDDDDEPWWNK